MKTKQKWKMLPNNGLWGDKFLQELIFRPHLHQHSTVQELYDCAALIVIEINCLVYC